MLHSSLLAACVLCLTLAKPYNVNRDKYVCLYRPKPPIQLQGRFGAPQPSKPVVLLENRLLKTAPNYIINNKPYKYNIKSNSLGSFFPNLTPINFMDFKRSEEPEEDDEPINLDKLWRVGELPTPKTVQKLPDVYVKDENTPAMTDLAAMEQSEFTEEAHYLEDQELGETFLQDAFSQPKDVVMENVASRKELSSVQSPTKIKFQNINLEDLMEKEEESPRSEELGASTPAFEEPTTALPSTEESPYTEKPEN